MSETLIEIAVVLGALAFLWMWWSMLRDNRKQWEDVRKTLDRMIDRMSGKDPDA